MHALQITISATCYIFNNPFKLFFCDVEYVIKFSIIISSCFCVTMVTHTLKWQVQGLDLRHHNSIQNLYKTLPVNPPASTGRLSGLKNLKSPASNQSPALNSPANVLERLIFWSAINLINLSIKSTFIY